MLPGLQHFGGRGACWSFGMRLGKMTRNGSPKIPKIGTPATLGPHNFVCKPSIEMRFKEKL
jgi:hypothetical protein